MQHLLTHYISYHSLLKYTLYFYIIYLLDHSYSDIAVFFESYLSFSSFSEAEASLLDKIVYAASEEVKSD